MQIDGSHEALEHLILTLLTTDPGKPFATTMP